ncbi:MAG: hypothetical protein IKG67_03300 [Parasporobacterium sp.]|nr:hypothetical protein [Parasporobacterium sp.]MBR3401249.1 hypothetical protein [Parasporobacterium sp.]
MKKIRKFFERIANSGTKRYCSCGHAVSANLPVCPHCGRRLTSGTEFPVD